jgi:KUP system potassium uptake protein
MAESVRPAKSSHFPPASRITRSRLPSFQTIAPPPSAAETPRVPYGLALGALGVVYGDLGTNPLFALQECFGGSSSFAPSQLNVLGVLSLVFWALALVITLKYLTFVMRASNDGEGGILALLALVPGKGKGARAERPIVLVLIVLFGAALLYGDGVVTPAISVLSAVEGLKTAAPSLASLVIPLTVVILILLFLVQKRGTEGIGHVFGPVMVVWFVAIGTLGVWQIFKNPIVLLAVDPRCAATFFMHGGRHAFLVLGAIVLCIAGGEALYADMGHFGRRPIALAWYAIVMPALLANYFGQGAYLLRGGTVASDSSPFYSIVPAPLLVPMIFLATAATVIASQALISGAYSLTHQAVQLGFCPRVNVVHTSEGHAGQIYVPVVNSLLMVACVALVIGFGASEKLAAAYGLAVTGTMSITSIAYFVVLWRTWKWPLWKAAPLVLFFLSFDLAFLTANLSKFFAGGWVPVGLGACVFTVMTTWMAGRKRLGNQFAGVLFPFKDFIDDITANPPPRVRGTAVFMSGNPNGIPLVLLHHYKHNQVLHQKVLLLSIVSEDTPYVSNDGRLSVNPLGQEIYQVIARFGFMETPDVPALVSACGPLGLLVDRDRTTYYLGREAMIVSARPGMAQWRKRFFALISRNARNATAYFGIPPDRVVELGMQIEI